MGKRGPQPGGATKAATAAKKAKAVPAAPKAQGTTRTKRTPTGAFDPAAGKDTYEPEAVEGRCWAAVERCDPVPGEVGGLVGQGQHVGTHRAPGGQVLNYCVLM